MAIKLALTFGTTFALGRGACGSERLQQNAEIKFVARQLRRIAIVWLRASKPGRAIRSPTHG
jgi:hypothetical protein